MASADYVVADRNAVADGGFPITAMDKVAEFAYENPDTDAKAAAASANVTKAAYIGYAAALNTFQSRPDIETLADRRTRENGTTFAAADFMRARVYNTDGTVRAAPRAGTVKGDADKSS